MPEELKEEEGLQFSHRSTAREYREMSHEEIIIYNLTHNEVQRLLSAIQGYSNSSFFVKGINRLLKNYVRPHRVKLPGPSYYRIKFH